MDRRMRGRSRMGIDDVASVIWVRFDYCTGLVKKS